MRKFLKIIFSIGLMLFATQSAYSEEYKVLVLPDNIQFDSTNYLIYPDSSIIFASDTINALKKDGRVKTVSMTEVRDALRKNTKLSIMTKNALKEFKYNYNIPFVDFKAIAGCFNTDKVLIITSQTDVQNHFLRRTLWDFLNIPGATVIDPAYKLSTFAALIDVKKELVIWQNTYYKKIGAMENRMIAQSFAPATEQLERIKLYSSFFLASDIAKKVETNILPPPIPTIPEKNGIINVTNIKKIEVIPSKKIEESKQKQENIIPLPQEIDLKPKKAVPKRPSVDVFENFGELINDI